jgi:signal transduction histidine kinase
MLRVLQEALANVARHAGARRVWVTVSYMDDVVTMDVRDDGAGFDPNAQRERSDGFGLTSMRQRIERAGGTLAVESASGEGTTVSATVPMSPQTEPSRL